jgi:hypothetical protein
MKKLSLLFIIAAISILACKKNTTPSNNNNNNDTTYHGTGSITKGPATVTVSSLYSCTGGRVTAMGTVTSSDGKIWTVPADNNFATGTKLPDLYNECNGHTPSNMSQVDTASVPLTVIDADGEIITGYLYGDNYYELYVNGHLVGVDAVPFTPFNSSFVKFKAKRPIKYAIKLVDWEENLGTGTELNGGNPFHAGDGGFIAKFSDGTVTNSSWKAQTFYIAPLTDVRCVTETGTSRISSSCNSTITSLSDAYALHWEVPSNWFDTGYNFTTWPAASIFTDAEVGPKVAYTNFTSQFIGAQFIWSSNIVLDNLVLLRFTGN